MGELQTAMTEEQERSIRRLEDLLKEQSDQLRRERREHAKGLEQLKSCSEKSTTKSSLLEEQVSALRQQLHREQSELRASERAWASDRAALLTTVAACERPTCQSRGSCGCTASRRKVGTLQQPRPIAGSTPFSGLSSGRCLHVR